MNDGVSIGAARSEEAGELTRIALAAKRHWGYPESWLEKWAAGLTMTPEYLATHTTRVARAGDRALGFCTVIWRDGEAWLEHLWVDPAAMGIGIGRRLFAAAEESARRAGAQCLRIESDPHAEGFYRRQGAMVYGHESADLDGIERRLPLLVKVL